MRIASKIIAGYALLIGIMAALLAYQVYSIRGMQSIVNRLSTEDFKAGRRSLDLINDEIVIAEYTRKYFVTADRGYANWLVDSLGAFQRGLEEIRPRIHSRRSLENIDRLLGDCNEFSKCFADYQGDDVKKKWAGKIPPLLEYHLALLNSRVQSVHSGLLDAVEKDVKTTQQLGKEAQYVFSFAAVFALLFSIFVSHLLARSISRPLSQLTAGTRAVADGKFFYLLDTSRGDEFGEVARDFNTMTRRLGELDTLKKDFVSHVSHELKSPLASMQETLRLLLDQLPGPLTDKQKRLLELNLQSARRLSAMIANLLDLSRMEAGALQYDIKPQDLAELLRTAVAECEPKAHEKQVSICLNEPDAHLPLECDHDRIIQVLENLLENAVKFSPRSSKVEICTSVNTGLAAEMPAEWRARLEARGNKGSYLTVVIQDRGPGVPEAHKEKIFERFHQITRGKKIAGQGVGLGLAISRTIVGAHGGAIWVEDNPGGGSRFVMILPSRPDEGQVHPVSPPI